MARLGRRTLFIILGAFTEGAILINNSQNATSKGIAVNSTATEKVEVIEAKDSITSGLAGKYRTYKGGATDSTINIVAKNSASIIDKNSTNVPGDWALFAGEDEYQEENSETEAQMLIRLGITGINKYYQEKGCLVIDRPRRGVMPNEGQPPKSLRDSKMTLDKCYYFCVDFRSIFMSVKDGDTCTCFDKYEYLHEPGPRETCNKPCSGSEKTNCGGDKASMVYVLEVWVPKLPKKDCGKPDEVPHIKEMCDNGGEEHGLTCDVKCEQGYRVAENSLMCDTAAGMWFGFVHCAPYLCLPPAPPIAFASKTCLGGAVAGVKHATFEVDCPVTCLPGYDLKENTLKCVEPSNSKEPAGILKGAARCEPRVCGVPKKVEHANAPLGIQAYPTMVQYTCQPGYTLTGELTGITYRHVPCQADGKYDDTPFQCLPLNCGKVPPVENAKLSFMPPGSDNGVFFPGAPVYKCEVGFSMDGTGTGERFIPVPCQATGKFPDHSPPCKPVICGGPPMVGFSKILKSDALTGTGVEEIAMFPLGYKQTATHLCEPGYSFLPDHDPARPNMEFITSCEDDGLFSNVRACAPVNCGKPPVADKTMRPHLDVHFGQHVEYSCLDGYSLTGKIEAARSFKLHCQENRRYTDLPPAKGCLPLECGRPSKVERAMLVRGAPGQLVKFPEAIQYKCDEGFSTDRTKSSGAAFFTVACESTGHFSDYWECLPIDDCIGHTCGPQGECHDLHLDYKCVCDRGFEPIMNELTMEKECGNINDCGPEACGEGRCEDLVEGYKCHCPTGYEVTTPEEAPKNETCSKVICGEPPIVRKANRPNVKASYQDRIEYACHVGYTLNGRAGGENMFHTVCQASKSFTSVPTCKPVSCGRAPRRRNARVDKRGVITYSEEIRYTCRTGYSTDGSLLADTKSFGAQCLETGSYSELLDCVPIICGAPKGLSFSNVAATVLTFRQRVRYNCLEGYSTDGSPDPRKHGFDAICQADGRILLGTQAVMKFSLRWPGDSGCLKNRGAKKKLIRNSKDGCAKFKVDGKAIKNLDYSGQCLDLFGRRDFGIWNCHGKGNQQFRKTGDKWCTGGKCVEIVGNQPSQPQGCQPVSCGRAPRVRNAVAELSEGNVLFPMLSAFSCHEGFSLDGKVTGERVFSAKCEANGKYSGVKKCKNVECGKPPNPPHSQIIQGGDIDVGVFGDLFKYKCHKGYGLEPLPTDLEVIQPGGDKDFAVTCQANGEYSAIATCKNIDDCAGHTCGPHGTCVDGIAKYSCDCQPGFEEVKVDGEPYCGNVDDCGNHKCGEHGTCVDQVMGYTCSCSLGYHIEKAGEDTMCEANSCGDMPVIENAEHGKQAEMELRWPGDSGCLKNRGAKKKLIRNSKDGCAKFKVEGKAIKNLDYSGQCLDLFGRRDFGLWRCHGKGNQQFRKTGDKWCTGGKCVEMVHQKVHTKLLFPMIVTYECKTGYSVDKTAHTSAKTFQVQCDANGDTRNMQTCSKVTCAPPGGILNLKKGPDLTKLANYQDKLSYECEDGFTTTGEAGGKSTFQLECGPDGLFKPDIFPVCAPVKCGKPKAVHKANYPEQDMFYPALVTYACDLGYSMDGTANADKLGFTVQCKKDGKFTDVPLADKKCKRVKCGKFPDVANAKYNKDVRGEFGDSQEYKCKNGFSVDGALQGQTSWSLTCQANGQFSESFECVPIVFTVLGQMKNAVNNRPVPGGKAVLTYKGHDEGAGPIESAGNRVGQFMLNAVRQGNAEIKYTAPGYIGAEIKLDVRSNIQAGTVADIAMSPVLSEDAWRAVLAWGKNPRDLDTHLYWKNRRSCHVYYARRRVDCPDQVKGILDVDDVSSFGPETLTFKNVGKRYNPTVSRMGERRAPILQYRIKNYSRRPNLQSRNDVNVKLYNGDRLVKEFKLGRDGEIKGRWWYVFELNGYTGQLIQ